MKRKAVEEALLKPSMLKMLEELVTDLAKEQPEDTGEEVAQVSRNKRIDSRLPPNWWRRRQPQ
tara:strand:+ start:378 stop:566 length:189 start_codon:yes stop_codon:yes gene_type:complete